MEAYNLKQILHIISSLSAGGAEMMLYKLISNSRNGINHKVISLTSKGLVAEKLKRLDVPVSNLKMSKNPQLLIKILGLRKHIKNYNPDIVQTWMYHSDLLGGLAAKLAGDYPVVWNIRHSNLNLEADKRTTIWTAKICAKLSGIIPQKIITCSKTAKQFHADLGYDKSKIKVIPNGFDIDEFKSQDGAKTSLVEELSIPEDSFLIAMVARFNPQKDFETLFSAMEFLRDEYFDLFKKTHLILCGNGITWDNDKLAEWIKKRELSKNVHLLGRRDDIPRIMAAVDINTLSSRSGEGFPNVIGEAMASETPCVVTDVGDAAFIVGDTGEVVAPRSPEKLAESWKKMMELTETEINKLGQKARQLILDNFEIGKIADEYLDVYKRILKD